MLQRQTYKAAQTRKRVNPLPLARLKFQVSGTDWKEFASFPLPQSDKVLRPQSTDEVRAPASRENRSAEISTLKASMTPPHLPAGSAAAKQAFLAFIKMKDNYATDGFMTLPPSRHRRHPQGLLRGVLGIVTTWKPLPYR